MINKISKRADNTSYIERLKANHARIKKVNEALIIPIVDDGVGYYAENEKHLFLINGQDKITALNKLDIKSNNEEIEETSVSGDQEVPELEEHPKKNEFLAYGEN
jgi:hypothetical protein